MPSERIEPLFARERRVLLAVENWWRHPDSSGALLRLWQETNDWLTIREDAPSDG